MLLPARTKAIVFVFIRLGISPGSPKPWGDHTGPRAPPSAAEVHPHADNGVPPLVHAEDLDQGFDPLSGGSSLVEAASVAEAVLMDTSGSPVITSPVAGAEDPVVGDACGGAPPPLVVDKCFN